MTVFRSSSRTAAQLKKAEKALADRVRAVYVIRLNESIDDLASSLRSADWSVFETAGPYGDEMEGWSRSARCLANHRNAWRRIASAAEPALVVEADFVPVVDLPRMPAPKGWNEQEESLGYLYVCGPQLWDLDGGLRGHAGGCVAYLVTTHLAARLVEFADEMLEGADPTGYLAWDARLGYWLNERSVQTYLPYRNYGEHGGLPNPEHRRAGLRATHRADLLAGRLAFLPAYARGSRVRYALERAHARLWGILRLLAGRYLAWRDLRRSSEKLRLLRVAVGRHFVRRCPGK